jgi:hypothetical protein
MKKVTKKKHKIMMKLKEDGSLNVREDYRKIKKEICFFQKSDTSHNGQVIVETSIALGSAGILNDKGIILRVCNAFIYQLDHIELTSTPEDSHSVRINELTELVNNTDLIRLLCIHEDNHNNSLMAESEDILDFSGRLVDNEGLSIKVIRNLIAQIFRDEVIAIYHLLNSTMMN